MSEKGIKLMLVEDNPGDVRLLEEVLRESGAQDVQLTGQAESLEQAMRMAEGEAFDLVLLDLSLPDSQGLETLVQMQQSAPGLAIVVLTGLDNEAMAVEALRKGAQDYLVKSQTDSRLLLRSVRYALQRRSAQLERERLIQQLQAAIANIKRLGGLLPICAWCKKIRDDQGYWKQVEQYIHEHSEADFSHSICPDCASRMMRQIDEPRK